MGFSLAVLALLIPVAPAALGARRRAITFEDYIALKDVSDPQLSPDGKWVAYTVSTPSLQDNRNVSRVTAAKRMGVDAKFLYFPDEGHWVLRPRNRRIWWGTVLDWMEGYLRERPHP